MNKPSLTRAVLVFANDGTASPRANLTSLIYNLHATTVHPGGCENASFKFKVPFAGSLVFPEFLGFNFELQLWDSMGCYWIGRIEDFEYDIQGDTVEWSVVAKGYGVNLDDQAYTSKNLQNTLTSTGVSNTLTDLTSQIDTFDITATGFTISNATAVTLKMQRASQMVNWLKRLGDAAHTYQVWYVYPDVNANVRFTFKPRPTAHELEAHLNDFTHNSGGLAGRRLYNSTQVQYNAGASTVTADDAALQAIGPTGWNLKKTLILFMNELTQGVDAQQVADTALAYFKTAKITSRRLIAQHGIEVLDANKQIVELTRFRAGLLFKYADLNVPQSPVTNVSLANTFLIAATDWDEDALILTITPESLDQLLDSIIGQSQIMLSGRLNLT